MNYYETLGLEFLLKAVEPSNEAADFMLRIYHNVPSSISKSYDVSPEELELIGKVSYFIKDRRVKSVRMHGSTHRFEVVVKNGLSTVGILNLVREYMPNYEPSPENTIMHLEFKVFQFKANDRTYEMRVSSE